MQVNELYINTALALANRHARPSGRAWIRQDIENYAPLSDGCSGRLSWIYALAGKEISCHGCCVLHDWLYQLGGGRKARRDADRLLMVCAANTGDLSKWWRKAGRWTRSRIMYATVRVLGRWFWGV